MLRKKVDVSLKGSVKLWGGRIKLSWDEEKLLIVAGRTTSVSIPAEAVRDVAMFPDGAHPVVVVEIDWKYALTGEASCSSVRLTVPTESAQDANDLGGRLINALLRPRRDSEPAVAESAPDNPVTPTDLVSPEAGRHDVPLARGDAGAGGPGPSIDGAAVGHSVVGLRADDLGRDTAMSFLQTASTGVTRGADIASLATLTPSPGSSARPDPTDSPGVPAPPVDPDVDARNQADVPRTVAEVATDHRLVRPDSAEADPPSVEAKPEEIPPVTMRATPFRDHTDWVVFRSSDDLAESLEFRCGDA